MQQQMMQLQLKEHLMAQQIMINQQMKYQKMMEILESNQNNNSQDNFLNITFKIIGKGDDSLQINIQINANEKVSSLIEKYRNKSGDYGEKKFIFNDKALNSFLTCAEAGLSDNSNVQVIEDMNELNNESNEKIDINS